jgi:putative Mg2+ transporter-C (MgtC) family protein
MLHIFDFAREMTLLAITVRMLLAAVCGGLIGVERELKRRPAGFRTHILICVGASMTILTNLYLYQIMHLYTDISRLGAQVITGISFIGAGTIIVTKRKRVKGLTTAAGLWTMAAVGLICGAGYLELAYFATAMVLLAELLLSKFEYRFVRKVEDVNLYVEYKRSACIEQILAALRRQKIKLTDLEITRINEGDDHRYCAILEVQTSKEKLDGALFKELNAIEDITNIEEL